MDEQHGPGMFSTDKEDWSRLPHSKRKDRPLTKDVLMKLQEKSDAKGFVQLLGNLGLIALSGAALGWIFLAAGQSRPLVQILLGVPLIFWHGFLLCALGFAAQHETIHMTAFKTKKINDFVGFWCSVPSFSFYYHELLMHKEHHTYTQDPQRDPELLADFSGMTYAGGTSGLLDVGVVMAAGKNGFKKVPKTRLEYILRFVDFPSYLRSKIDKLWRCARGQPVDYSSTTWKLPVSPGDPNVRGTPAFRLKQDARFQILITFILILGFGLIFGLTPLLILWLLPAFVGVAPLYFVQLHEHANVALDPDDGLSNTRTTLTHPLISFAMWNMAYHAEHHLYTTIPFHALPKAHALLKAHIKHLSPNGHLAVHASTLSEWIPQQSHALQNAAAAKKINKKAD